MRLADTAAQTLTRSGPISLPAPTFFGTDCHRPTSPKLRGPFKAITWPAVCWLSISTASQTTVQARKNTPLVSRHSSPET
jgi:hypothetical protein